MSQALVSCIWFAPSTTSASWGKLASRTSVPAQPQRALPPRLGTCTTGARTRLTAETMSRVMFTLGTMLRETGQVLDRIGCSMQGSNAFREAISKHRTVAGIYDKVPALPAAGFVAPSASVIGDVTIGEKSSVWYGTVLRGDVNRISIGSMTNIQDNTVIHVAKTNVGGVAAPTTVGDRVTVGHNAILHACTIQDDAFVGMGATVMDGAVVEKGAMVAAGALVTPGTVVPSGQLWAGAPARFMRDMTAEEKAFTVTSAETYAEVGAVHAAECGKSHEEIMHDVAARQMARERDADYDSHLGVTRDQVKVQV